MQKKPDVLFVCVHNAGRSQMAKAFFNDIAARSGSQMSAESAGTIPSNHVHPEVLSTMRELGFDLSQKRGKLLTDEMLQHQPKVITMGCQVDAEACPSLLMDEVVDWALPDPKGQSVERVREIRDEIKQRVEKLFAELAAN